MWVVTFVWGDDEAVDELGVFVSGIDDLSFAMFVELVR